MVNQQQIHGTGGGEEPGEDATASQVHISTAGTDDLLDEIDSLLDNNTEEFVRSYVQKGGE